MVINPLVLISSFHIYSVLYRISHCQPVTELWQLWQRVSVSVIECHTHTDRDILYGGVSQTGEYDGSFLGCCIVLEGDALYYIGASLCISTQTGDCDGLPSYWTVGVEANLGSKARSWNQYDLTGFETIEEQNIFFAHILLQVRRER